MTTSILLGGDIVPKKPKQLKAIDPSLPFPSLLAVDSFKLIHIESSFPTKTTFVSCNYDDTPFVAHKVHMKNSGSCVVPKGRTITLHEWRRQNGLA